MPRRFLTLTTRPDEIRTEELRGRSYTVVPTIGLVEGVLNGMGSPGPELALADEFGDVPAAWNGRPVTLGHPQRDGQYVSANRTDVFEKETVGFMFNASLKGDKAQKLSVEMWLDTELTPKEELNRISSGKQIEVSTGFFADAIPWEGEYGGKQFEAILVNIKPDHLALLAEGDIGACSFEDGCGAPRVNIDKVKLKALKAKLKQTNSDQCDCKGKCKDGDCSCNGESAQGTKVNQLRLHTQGKGDKRSQAINQVVEGLQTLLEEEENMDKDALISKIIAAKGNTFTEDDKDTLSKLSLNALKGLLANGEAGEEQENTENAGAGANSADTEDDVESSDEDNSEADKEGADAGSADEDGKDEEEVSEAEPSVQQYLDAAPPAVRQVLNAGLRELKTKQSKFIKDILANKANTFSREDLQAMALEDLEKVAKLASKKDFSGKGGPKAQESGETTAPKTYLGPRTAEEGNVFALRGKK